VGKQGHQTKQTIPTFFHDEIARMKTVVVVNPDLLFSVPRKPTLILQAREFNAMLTLFVNHLRYAPQVSDLVLAVPKVSSAGSRQGERNNPMLRPRSVSQPSCLDL